MRVQPILTALFSFLVVAFASTPSFSWTMITGAAPGQIDEWERSFRKAHKEVLDEVGVGMTIPKMRSAAVAIIDWRKASGLISAYNWRTGEKLGELNGVDFVSPEGLAQLKGKLWELKAAADMKDLTGYIGVGSIAFEKGTFFVQRNDGSRVEIPAAGVAKYEPKPSSRKWQEFAKSLKSAVDTAGSGIGGFPKE